MEVEGRRWMVIVIAPCGGRKKTPRGEPGEARLKLALEFVKRSNHYSGIPIESGRCIQVLDL